MRLLGTDVAAKTRRTRTVAPQEPPIVEMSNTYFDQIGLFVEPETTVRHEILAGARSTSVDSDQAPTGIPAFDGVTISQKRFEHTFETPVNCQ